MTSKCTEKGYQWGVAALRNRRAEIAGDVARLRMDLKNRLQDLGKLDDVLLILSPDSDPKAINAKRKPQKYTNLFRQGQLNGLILGIVRAAGRPVSNLEVRDALQEKMGVPDVGREPLRRRANGNLHYLKNTGRLVRSDDGLWSIPPD